MPAFVETDLGVILKQPQLIVAQRIPVAEQLFVPQIRQGPPQTNEFLPISVETPEQERQPPATVVPDTMPLPVPAAGTMIIEEPGYEASGMPIPEQYDVIDVEKQGQVPWGWIAVGAGALLLFFFTSRKKEEESRPLRGRR